MKVIVLESPQEHTVCIGKNLRNLLEIKGYDAVFLEFLSDADRLLSGGEYKAVIIHHDSFVDVDYLKPRHPDAVYIGHSNNLFSENRFSGETMGNLFRKAMEAHYDKIFGLDNWREIYKALEEIASAKDAGHAAASDEEQEYQESDGSDDD